MKKAIQKVIIVLMTLFAWQGCSIGGSGVWKNENIDKDEKEQISMLNDKLYASIIKNDSAAARSLMSDTLLSLTGDFGKLLKDVNSRIKAGSYKILGEYHVRNSNAGIQNTLPSGFSDDNDYTINYLALNEEMYVSLLLPNVDEDENETLITVIYGRHGDEWKINILRFGPYSYFHKTAPEYYKLAKASYDKSFLIDAANYTFIAKQCLRPAGDYFQFQKETEINEFEKTLMKEVYSKYQFPLKLDNIKSKPAIFNIYPEMHSEGFFPMVRYLSVINLDDTTALKIENDKMQSEIGTIFPGIDKEKKFVFYRAFNEMPDGKKLVRHYGIIHQLN
jgi:hypothetical protein